MTETISREISDPSGLLPADNGLLPIEDRRQKWSRQKQQFDDIPVASIRPAKDSAGKLLNPRTRFDPDYIEELSRSIAVHGLLSPITVRPVASKNTEPSIAHKIETMDGYGSLHYEIIAGECRWRAAKLANLLVIPAIVRGGVSDAELAELALIENVRRNDLSVLEKARAFKRCIELGTKQKDIGEKSGVSQGRVASLIGLLDLPADVQQMIEDGKLTAGHGIQLARYKDFPELCRHFAKLAVDAQWPVKLLEGGLVRQITRMAAQEQLLIALPTYNTVFDWKAVCVKNCPFKAFRGASDQQEGGYCLNPAHYKELQAEAEAAKDAQTQEEAARLREKAQAAAEAARQAATAAPNAAARVDAERDAARAEKIVQSTENGLPDLTKLSYKEYVEIGATTPPGCTENCACRGRGRSWGGKVIECCTDPKRYSALKGAVEKVKTRDLKETLSEKLHRAEVAATSGDAARLTVILLTVALMNATGAVKKRMADVLAEEPVLKQTSGPKLKVMLTSNKPWEVKAEALWPLLVVLPAERQMSLALETRMRDEMDSALANRTGKTPLMDWMIDGLMIAGTPAVDGASTDVEPRLYPCADCKTKDAGAFWVDANGYDVDKHAMLGEWVCDLCQDKRKAAAHAEQTLCANCEEPLTTGAFESAIAAAAARQNPLRMDTGELLLPDGRAFCEQCGPRRDDNGAPLPEPDSDNEGPLCGCGEPTCLGTCAAPEPWEYDRPDGLPSFAVGDAVEVRFNAEWYPGGVVGHGVPPSGSVFVLVTGYSAPTLFAPSAIRKVTQEKEAVHALAL